MFEKIKLTVLALLVSHYAVSGTSGCEQSPVTIPCEHKMWTIGVEALYLKPVYGSHRTYLIDGTQFYKAENKWGVGYQINGSYTFNTGNEIDVSWLHYDVTSHPGHYMGSVPNLGRSEYTISQLNRFDQVNALLSQHIAFDDMKHAKFYAGMQYANIRSDQNKQYVANNTMRAAELTGVREYNNADFNGVGPLAGALLSFDMAPDLALRADVSGALLFGTTRHNLGYVYAPNPVVNSIRYASKKSMVPELSAKISLNYAHQLAKGTLNVYGGYQAIQYFNAFELVTANDSGSSDFGLFGPYIGLNWVGLA